MQKSELCRRAEPSTKGAGLCLTFVFSLCLEALTEPFCS